MKPTVPSQLPLPLTFPANPPPATAPTLRLTPGQVWTTLSVADQARVRTVWLRVLREVTNEQP